MNSFFPAGLRRSLKTGGLLVWLETSSGWSAEDWKAGAAKANLTPDGPMWMAGYARDRPTSANKPLPDPNPPKIRFPTSKPAPAAEWKKKLAAFQQAAKVSDNKSETP